MEGLANAVYTKLFPVKMTSGRLPCKRLPRRARILIRATRWDGFVMSLQLVKDSYSWLFAAIDGYLTY